MLEKGTLQKVPFFIAYFTFLYQNFTVNFYYYTISIGTYSLYSNQKKQVYINKLVIFLLSYFLPLFDFSARTVRPLNFLFFIFFIKDSNTLLSTSTNVNFSKTSMF